MPQPIHSHFPDMALNLQVFRTRTITALVFAAVMLTGLLWNFWGFLALFLTIHAGCWYELLLLLKKIDPARYIYRSFWGLLYITMPCGLMIHLGYLSFDEFGTWADLPYESGSTHLVLVPIAIVSAIWINDTMAYVVGSLIGKTPLSAVSPKKTWEGTIGGILLSILVTGFLFSRLYSHQLASTNTFEYRFGYWFIIAGIASIAGTFGDLLESKLKRVAGVKDSGSIMPGHGGFLDRFDSLLIAIPCVWLFVML